jgi:hypothetical protein
LEAETRLSKALATSEFVVKLTAKTGYARLHLRNGCWRAQDERDAHPFLYLDEAKYDGICHLRWPKGARPLEPHDNTGDDTHTAIRAVAGIMTQTENKEDDSSTTESSSSESATSTLAAPMPSQSSLA